jgi:hypothetical protein
MESTKTFEQKILTQNLVCTILDWFKLQNLNEYIK